MKVLATALKRIVLAEKTAADKKKISDLKRQKLDINDEKDTIRQKMKGVEGKKRKTYEDQIIEREHDLDRINLQLKQLEKK